jgi:hypothetical protein
MASSNQFKPVQTSINSSNRKKEKKYCSLEIGIPPPPNPKQKKNKIIP